MIKLIPEEALELATLIRKCKYKSDSSYQEEEWDTAIEYMAMIVEQRAELTYALSVAVYYYTETERYKAKSEAGKKLSKSLFWDVGKYCMRPIIKKFRTGSRPPDLHPKRKYLNQFHKESTEKSLKAIAEMKKTPVNYEEELKRHAEMHKRTEILEKEWEEAWANRQKQPPGSGGIPE